MIAIASPLVFPVGHYVGAHHPHAGAELDFHVVRIGWEIYRIETNEQFAVWALAHGVPDQTGGTAGSPWTRAGLEGAALATGLPDTPAVLTELLAKDLVIEVTPDTAEAVEFAKVCRLRSLLAGLGNTAADPQTYGIGLVEGSPLAAVPQLAFELWKWGHACDSLWHIGQILAQAGREIAPEDPTQTDPEQQLGRILESVQLLIARGAAYLDEAREEV